MLKYGIDMITQSEPTETIQQKFQTCFSCDQIKRGVCDRTVWNTTYEHICKDCAERREKQMRRQKMRQLFGKL